jgi:hypothetical protein
MVENISIYNCQNMNYRVVFIAVTQYFMLLKYSCAQLNVVNWYVRKASEGLLQVCISGN